jgi:hypothetical protein
MYVFDVIKGKSGAIHDKLMWNGLKSRPLKSFVSASVPLFSSKPVLAVTFPETREEPKEEA